MEGEYPPNGFNNKELCRTTGFISTKKRRELAVAVFGLNLVNNYVDCPQLLAAMTIRVPVMRARQVISLSFYPVVPLKECGLGRPSIALMRAVNDLVVKLADNNISLDCFSLLSQLATGSFTKHFTYLAQN